MRIAHLRIALFALMLIAPVASLVLGTVELYGAPRTEFPPLAKVLQGKKGRFDQLGDALLERSAARKLAIRMRNWFGYRLVGFVDAGPVLSGEGGWLFYRHDFNNGKCLDLDRTAAILRKLDTLVDLARATGIDTYVSVSPDKSAVYPEMLSGFARAYWKCRVENAAILRRLIKREAPSLIDHTEPLLAEKSRRPDVPLYFMTDTHWTDYGAALALQQLLAAIYPDLVIPTPRLGGAKAARQTDLSRMLLLPVNEEAPKADPSFVEALIATVPDSVGRRTVIAHDSFYVALEPRLRAIFPNAAMVHVTRTDHKAARAEISTADRLIVNMVERNLLRQLYRGVLDWDAPIATAILARNVARVADCVSFDRVDPRQSADTVRIRRVPAQHLPCLRLTIARSGRAMVEVDLPNAWTGEWEAGRTLEYTIPAGSETVGFVLPHHVAGSRIRVRVRGLDQAVSVLAVEVGETAERTALRP